MEETVLKFTRAIKKHGGCQSIVIDIVFEALQLSRETYFYSNSRIGNGVKFSHERKV